MSVEKLKYTIWAFDAEQAATFYTRCFVSHRKGIKQVKVKKATTGRPVRPKWLFQGPPAKSKFPGASQSPERRGWRS